MSGHFLENALIYLGAAVVCVPLAKKLGLGSVLGYLLAGMIIGPYLLGFIGEEGDDILHIAEFGVVIMLFLIGLELEPKAFWRMRKQIVGLGGWQLLLSTLLLGLLATWVLEFSWSAALALALALSMSSTALVLASISEVIVAGRLVVGPLLRLVAATRIRQQKQVQHPKEQHHPASAPQLWLQMSPGRCNPCGQPRGNQRLPKRLSASCRIVGCSYSHQHTVK